MYRQILTVTYDTRAAPFLTIRVLQQLVEDEGKAFLMIAPILLNDTFVDDLLFGTHDFNTALKNESKGYRIVVRNPRKMDKNHAGLEVSQKSNKNPCNYFLRY